MRAMPILLAALLVARPSTALPDGQTRQLAFGPTSSVVNAGSSVRPSDETRTVVPSGGGALELSSFDLSIRPFCVVPPWRRLNASGGWSPETDGSVLFDLNPKAEAGCARILGRLQASADEGGVRAHWTLTPTKDAQYVALGVSLPLPADDFAGGILVADGRRVEIPKTFAGTELVKGAFRRLEICDAHRRIHLVFSFDRPQGVYVQDDRKWTIPSLDVRLWVGNAKALKEGEPCQVEFVLSGAGGLGASPQPLEVSAGSEWIPVASQSWITPGSALDFSSLVPSDSPAGCHGRVVVQGGHFAFEDSPDIPRRFYGVNVCGRALFAPPEAVRRWAANVRRIGYNTVRIHHHDSWLVSRSASNPGRTELDPRAMAGFDEFVAACRANGLYLTTDLFVSRTWANIAFRAVGIDRPGNMDMNQFKMLAPVHSGVCSNMLAFTRNLFTHRNGVTGLTLAEDPALACVAIVNEGDLDKYAPVVLSHWPAWQEAWHGYAGRDKPFPSQKTAEWFAFIGTVETSFVSKVRAFLSEELGMSRVLLTNSNEGILSPELSQVRHEAYDYLDNHLYFDHPQFLGEPWKLPTRIRNQNPFRQPLNSLTRRGKARLADRPFAMSEYNSCWPGRYRASSGVFMGALAARDDWSAIWRFCWADEPSGISSPASCAIGAFSMASDPIALAADRANVLLFLRGDLAVGAQDAMTINKEDGSFAVVTPRTVCGFAESGRVAVGPLSTELGPDPATVWVTALDGRDLTASRHLLVAHLTDVQNSGARYADDSGQILLARGSLPLIARRGRAELTLTTDVKGTWSVYPLSLDGVRQKNVQAVRSGEFVRFAVDTAWNPSSATFYYELTFDESFVPCWSKNKTTSAQSPK